MKNEKLKTKGFTLIELLVVIAIIGLLSSIMLASLGETKWKAQIAATKADLISLRTEMELLVDPVSGTYPSKLCSCNGDAAEIPPSNFPVVGSRCPQKSGYLLGVGTVPITMAEAGGTQALKNVVAMSAAMKNSGQWPGRPDYGGPACWTGEVDADGRIKEWAVWFSIDKLASTPTSFCIDSRGAARRFSSDTDHIADCSPP